MKQSGKLTKEFEEAAILHSYATYEGDHKSANQAFERLISVATKLKKLGLLHELRNMTDHINCGVVLWAGTYLLSLDENNGIAALRRVAALNNIHSFGAEITLREWKSKKLIIPFHTDKA